MHKAEAFDDFVAGLPAFMPMLAGDDGTPFLDWLTKVGQWLWEHREEIMKFIMEIIALFGG